MKTAGVVGAVALALVLQTTMARFLGGAATVVDLVLVVVVYVGLSMGPVAGLLTGSRTTTGGSASSGSPIPAGFPP